MRRDGTRTFNQSLMHCFSVGTSVCVFLSISIYTINLELPTAIKYAVDIYINARELIFSVFRLEWVIQSLAKYIDVNVTLHPPWQDVAVILFLYTMVQVWDAKIGALNCYYAMAWRFISGIVGITGAIIILSIVLSKDIYPAVQSIIIGVTIGLLIFRALHPFQLGFDVGWKSLIKEDRAKPITIWQYVVFIFDLIRTDAARAMFIKKISSVLKLSLWVFILLLIYGAYGFMPPEWIGPNSEFIFLICFMLTICLFQIFMESKSQPPR